MACRPTSQIRAARPAFTLVELLVVIAIIALLAAILLPVLGRAYRLAKSSADAALIHQIAMGCEAYNQVFKQYPPSTWDPAAPDAQANMWPPPYAAPHQSVFGSGGLWPADTRPRLVGAAKVYAFLSGFDAVGCWDPTNVYNWNPDGWDETNPPTNSCGALTHRGIIVDTVKPPYGPYYDPDEKGQTPTTIRWGAGATETVQQIVFASRFARQTPPAGGIAENGAPILYYRAATAPKDADGDGIEPWEIYSWRDNHPITDPTNAASGSWGAYDADASTHPLYVTSDGVRPDGTLADTDGDGKADIFGIARPGSYGTGATGQVYNATTFILISPGPDGEYFTADDITNFRS